MEIPTDILWLGKLTTENQKMTDPALRATLPFLSSVIFYQFSGLLPGGYAIHGLAAGLLLSLVKDTNKNTDSNNNNNK